MAAKGNEAGFDYETEMGGLVALRLCNEPNIQDFKLTINDPNIKAVDDIIFSYNVFGEKPVTVYGQLKQFDSKSKKIGKAAFEVNKEEKRDKKEKKKNDGFSLFKYYEAFKKVKSEDPIWNDIDRENEMFVLYTTAKIDPNELESVEMFTQGKVVTVTVKHQSCDEPLLKLMSTGNKGEVYKFAVKGNQNVMDNFFDCFLLFVKQSSVNCLKGMIKECIQTLLGHRGDDTKLENTVLKYIQYIKHRKISTEKKPFTKEEILSQVIWFYTESLHIAPNSTFALADSNVGAWTKLISNKQIIVVNEYKVEYVNALQFCIEINMKEKKNTYLCLNLEQLYLDDQIFFKYLSEMRQFVKINSYQTLLLISEQEVNAQQKKFLKNVVNTLANNQHRKLIIVCKNIDDIISNIPDNVEKFCSLNDLDSDNFLMMKPINYYGNPTTLNDFVEKYPGVENYFKTHHLLDLFLSELNIGTTACYDLDFYIERKATVSVLEPTVLKFKEMKKIIVCISGDFDKSDLDGASYIEVESVSDASSLENCNFITIPYYDSTLKHLEAFRKLKNKISKKEFILVLVSKEDNAKFWRIVVASDMAKEILKEFIDERDVPVKVKGDITIIAGEPGMGKSTFCQHIWRNNVINLVLTFIITQTDLKNVCNLKELIEDSFKNHSDLTKQIFNYHCSNKNVLFVLDAFDELGITAANNALQVIKDCVDNNYC